MYNLLRPIDQLLNRFTMYKVVLYGLLGLWSVALVLALTGQTGMNAADMAISLAVLVAVSWATTAALAAFFKAPYSRDSYFITALILAFLLPPADTLPHLMWTVLCAVIAAASKYLITWRGTHLFNPAAFGAVVLSIAGVLPAIWWVATPELLPFTALLALIVLRKQRNFQLFGVFALVALAMLLLNEAVLGDQAVVEVIKTAATSWPIVFMGSIMLTEPLTLPAGKQNQLLMAGLVGAIFAAELHAGPVSTTPQLALVVGNLFAVMAVAPFGATVRLKRLTTIAPNTLELVFDEPRQLRFTAGQYIEMTLDHPKADLRGNRRTFSIASAPHEAELAFGVRVYTPSSTFKTAMQHLQPGQTLRVANIKGNFVLPANTREPLLFIAGGIGITPFRSMISELLLTNQSRDIRLLYVAASPEQFAYKDLLEKARQAGVQTDYVIAGFDMEQLNTMVPDFAQRRIYISGPDGMVRHYEHLLRGQGVPGRQIRKDHFSGY